MPKSEINSRPYNRTEKREVKKNKRSTDRALKSGVGKFAYSGAGPGRMHNSGGVASQARRELNNYTDNLVARKIKGKRGRK